MSSWTSVHAFIFFYQLKDTSEFYSYLSLGMIPRQLKMIVMKTIASHSQVHVRFIQSPQKRS